MNLAPKSQGGLQHPDSSLASPAFKEKGSLMALRGLGKELGLSMQSVSTSFGESVIPKDIQIRPKGKEK